MSMFSIHWLIRGPNGGYWNGKNPKLTEDCFTDDHRAQVRFDTRESAEAVLTGVMKTDADTYGATIEEDE